MKSLFDSLPTDVLRLIVEYVEGPVYRPIPTLARYMKPEYSVLNPRLYPMARHFIDMVAKGLIDSSYQDELMPDIVYEDYRFQLPCILGKLSKDPSPESFELVKEFIDCCDQDHHIISNLLSLGDKERLDWVVKRVTKLDRYQLCDLLHNPSSYALDLFIELTDGKIDKMAQCLKDDYAIYRNILSNPSEKALYLTKNLLLRRLRLSPHLKYLVCSVSPHFFSIYQEKQMAFDLSCFPHICFNNNDQTIGFLKEHFPLPLQTESVRINLFRNPNDKVLDYLLQENPLTIPSGDRLCRLVVNLLHNTNPRIEPFLNQCLDRLISSGMEINYTVLHAWSECQFPSVLQKLRHHPDWIVKSSISTNPTDAAIDLIELWPSRIYLEMLCYNPNPRALPIITDFIDGLDDIEQQDVLEKVFKRSDSVEIDKEATMANREEFVRRLFA